MEWMALNTRRTWIFEGAEPEEFANRKDLWETEIRIISRKPLKFFKLWKTESWVKLSKIYAEEIKLNLKWKKKFVTEHSM